MLFLEIILLAVGLSMDSLAVSVTGGAVIRNCTASHIIRIATVMGIFQAGFTVIGYLAGMGFQKYICAFDHWIAFFLLLYLGGKMILGTQMFLAGFIVELISRNSPNRNSYKIEVEI